MSEPSGAQQKQEEKKAKNAHEIKKGKLQNAPEVPLVYNKKQQVALEEGKDVKKEEEKKRSPKGKNMKKILPHNAETHELLPLVKMWT